MARENLKITKKPLKGDDGYKTFSIRIKNELIDEIDKISSLTNRSRNELIGILLEYATKNCEIEEK